MLQFTSTPHLTSSLPPRQVRSDQVVLAKEIRKLRAELAAATEVGGESEVGGAAAELGGLATKTNPARLRFVHRK